MDQHKQDDRNTGCIHTHYFIWHLHLHLNSKTQEAEQHQIEKETEVLQINEPQTRQTF